MTYDNTFSYEELLYEDGLVSIHHKNMQALAAEMFKIKNAMSPEIVSDILLLRTENHHNLKQQSDFLLPSVLTTYQGSDGLPYLGPKNRNNIHIE